MACVQIGFAGTASVSNPTNGRRTSSDRGRGRSSSIWAQVGKSTTVAALALHTCLYTPGGLVLVIAPSQRQSRELFIKIHSFLQRLEPPETLEEETKLSLMMSNGSRAVVLPGDGRTIRGYSSPALILMDEAAFIADEVFDATLPMLAAAPEGRIILMSTPYTSAGFFYYFWHNADGWERVEFKTADCPRVCKEMARRAAAGGPVAL